MPRLLERTEGDEHLLQEEAMQCEPTCCCFTRLPSRPRRHLHPSLDRIIKYIFVCVPPEHNAATQVFSRLYICIYLCAPGLIFLSPLPDTTEHLYTLVLLSVCQSCFICQIHLYNLFTTLQLWQFLFTCIRQIYQRSLQILLILFTFLYLLVYLRQSPHTFRKQHHVRVCFSPPSPATISSTTVTVLTNGHPAPPANVTRLPLELRQRVLFLHLQLHPHIPH